MMLSAHSLRLGACWIGVINTEYDRPIKKLLGVPEDLAVLCIVSLGYPNERPAAGVY
jgi:nitroreductase